MFFFFLRLFLACAAYDAGGSQLLASAGLRKGGYNLHFIDDRPVTHFSGGVTSKITSQIFTEDRILQRGRGNLLTVEGILLYCLQRSHSWQCAQRTSSHSDMVNSFQENGVPAEGKGMSQPWGSH